MENAESKEQEKEGLTNEEQKEHIRQTLLRLLADQRGMEIKGVTIKRCPIS